MSDKEKSLSELGIYGLIDRVKESNPTKKTSTVYGIGQEAAVAGILGHQLFSTALFLEGIHFDLTYTPLQHLGYKSMVSAISDIIAMNGEPHQVIVSLGISNKLDLEKIDLLMVGIKSACEKYNIDIAGFKPSASLTGLTIGIAITGGVLERDIILRSNAKPTDLVCVTGDLGSALLGLHILEREKRVLKGTETLQPEFGDNDYVLKRQLKPEIPVDAINKIKALNIKPTSMLCIKEGLATTALLMSRASMVGCRIHERKIPLHQNTLKAASELNFNPLIAALNGGEDYEMMFTISLSDYESNKDNFPEEVSVIGYVCEEGKGCRIISTSDQEIDIKAQGWGTMV